MVDLNQVIVISIAQQRLQLRENNAVVMDVAIATAKNGPGEKAGSECTPCGWHQVRAKIGTGAELGTVFNSRRPTGEIFSPQLREQFPERDWILTRILWLSGLEPGKNRLGDVDTMRRYIYIHGCANDVEMGVPTSHGCVNMRNEDVIDLFDRITPGTRVYITEDNIPDDLPAA